MSVPPRSRTGRSPFVGRGGELHAALRRIEAACPELGRHLAASIRTGNVCSYEPDPAAAVLWELSPHA